MTADVVRKGVETALERLQIDCVDVMQFRWWQYQSQDYLDVLEHPMRLRKEGLIGEIGPANFDASHLRMLIKDRIEIASNPFCFFLRDRRRARQSLARVWAKPNTVSTA
ncbi:aldo/keto reductase [Roseobacter sp. YSTF-M11]|uniref:Aldo/keto reductase n=1 Tax=Roseobacter insulae TaxID=2859783 RepID=A0A9X1FVK8_9RHOB|nr:aldo/keto reductase [Roseobacter insulae]MBW4708416.1 aldo/keto reductase [Roseobacter insulae]